ncbi:MAG: PPOX class F420-dependent oxidoreductase [Nitrosopumilus sp. H8]|nr:MAG: PPOX class F420-dependent oxidoreductase [Nitrosopumilus sp. H8]
MQQKSIELLSGKNLVFLATVMQDGSPQVTPVWANYEDCHILVNTAEGRLKHKNILRDPRVAVSVTSAENPLDTTSIRGTVTEVVPDYEYEHADRLARQYMGCDYPFRRSGERRAILKIRPEKVFVMPPLVPDR